MGLFGGGKFRQPRKGRVVKRQPPPTTLVATKSEIRDSDYNRELLAGSRVVLLSDVPPRELGAVDCYQGICTRPSIEHKLRRYSRSEFVVFHDDRPPHYPLVLAYKTGVGDIRYYPIKMIEMGGPGYQSTRYFVGCLTTTRPVLRSDIPTLLEYHSLFATIGPPVDSFDWWVDDNKFPEGHKSLMTSVSTSTEEVLSETASASASGSVSLSSTSAPVASAPLTPVTITDVSSEALLYVLRYKGVRSRRDIERLLTLLGDFALYHLDAPPLCPLLIGYKTSLGEFRHYPVMRRGDLYMVDCSDPREATFPTIQRMINYHQIYGFIQLGPYLGHPVVDVFPWWIDDKRHPNGRSLHH